MTINIIMFCLYPQSNLNKMSADEVVRKINNIKIPITEDMPFRQLSAATRSEEVINILYRIHQKIMLPSIERESQEFLIEKVFHSKIFLSEGLLLCYTSSRKIAMEISSFIKDGLLGNVGEIARVEFPDRFLRKLRDDYSLYTSLLRIKAEDPLNQIVLMGKDVRESPVYRHFRLNRNEILGIEVKPQNFPFEGVFLRFEHTGIVKIKGVKEIHSEKYEKIEKEIMTLIREIYGKICPEKKLTEFGDVY